MKPKKGYIKNPTLARINHLLPSDCARDRDGEAEVICTLHPPAGSKTFLSGSPGFPQTNPTFNGSVVVTTSKPLSPLPTVLVTFTAKDGGTVSNSARSRSLVPPKVHPRFIIVVLEDKSLEYRFSIAFSQLGGYDWLPDAHIFNDERLDGGAVYHLETVVMKCLPTTVKHPTIIAKAITPVPFAFFSKPTILIPPAARPLAGWVENRPVRLGPFDQKYSTPTDLSTISGKPIPYLLDLTFTTGTLIHIDTNPIITFRIRPKYPHAPPPKIKSVEFELVQRTTLEGGTVMGRSSLTNSLRGGLPSSSMRGLASTMVNRRKYHVGYDVVHIFSVTVGVEEGRGLWGVKMRKVCARCLVEFSLGRLGDLRRDEVVGY
ncbi:hypothetical protein HDV00_006816 [Rhizophlyctis rosea]|nr:hypothetical protein HDV00_006816 [Rhizophlyctis rosea]